MIFPGLVNAPIVADIPAVIRWNQIQTVRAALNGPYSQAVWDPVERQEHQRNFDKLASQTSQPRDTIIKAPATSAFVRWDQDGFSKTNDLDRAKGYFYQDTQYIQTFIVSDEKGKLPQSIQKTPANNRQQVNYVYQFPDKTGMWIKRTESLTPKGVLETFRIQNKDTVSHTVNIDMNTGFEDFFKLERVRMKKWLS